MAYSKEWRTEMPDGTIVTRSNTWSPPGSHPVGYGVKVVTKDGKLIRIEQDAEARPPIAVFHPWNDRLLTLFKHLDDGTYALGFFNLGENDAEMFATFSDFGLPAAAGYDMALESVFDDEDIIGREYVRTKVPAHDCRVYIAKLQKR